MYRHYEGIKTILNALDHPPEDLGPFIFDKKYVISRKGYGTPALELRFLHKVFLYIQSTNPAFESISWHQTNAYNDEYYHIDLGPFELNEKVELYSDITFYFESFEGEEMKSNIFFIEDDNHGPEATEYAKINNITIGEYGIEEPDYDGFVDHLHEKYQHLKNPCLKFLVLLKMLELNYSMYYFLYTFGNGVKVKFDKEGVTIRQLDKNEIDGSPLGVGMYLDDF